MMFWVRRLHGGCTVAGIGLEGILTTHTPKSRCPLYLQLGLLGLGVVAQIDGLGLRGGEPSGGECRHRGAAAMSITPQPL